MRFFFWAWLYDCLGGTMEKAVRSSKYITKGKCWLISGGKAKLVSFYFWVIKLQRMVEKPQLLLELFRFCTTSAWAKLPFQLLIWRNTSKIFDFDFILLRCYIRHSDKIKGSVYVFTSFVLHSVIVNLLLQSISVNFSYQNFFSNHIKYILYWSQWRYKRH